MLVAAALALAAACAPADGLNFVCGPRAAEDIVQVPGTRWLITSGLATDRPAQLWFVEHRTRRATPAFPMGPASLPRRPHAAWRAHCAGPPDAARMSMDGLGLAPGRGGRHQLFAANHGDRHAIEVFDLQMRHGQPRIAWAGCVPLPAHTLANAVVPLRDGGLVMASFHDPDDMLAWSRMARGESTGSVWEWHAASGWRELPAGPLAGANGLALSANERMVIVSAWAGLRLVEFARDGSSRREMQLDFMPDNLHAEPDGRLLVGGQRSRVADVAACARPACPQPWVVARVDLRTGQATTLVEGQGNALVSYACGALRVGNELYITVRGDNRLAWKALLPRHR